MFPRQTPPRRLFGFSEVWRDDGGTRMFDLLFVRVWKRELELDHIDPEWG